VTKVAQSALVFARQFPATSQYSPQSATPHRDPLKAEQQLRQLRYIDPNPPRLVLREQLGGRSPAGLLLEINVSELLAATVNHDKASGLFLD
jgi:hypothetical protein